MKYILSGILVLFFVPVLAQPSHDIIKKFKLLFYQEFKEYNDGGDEHSSIAMWWFDRKGDDSLVYKYYDTLLANYNYKNTKLVSRTYTDPQGKVKERYDYEYKPDGSYMITYTDGSYGLKSFEWFDNKNKILKSRSPDGNTINYKYDPKGRLLSMQSDGKNSGVHINRKFYYNAKGLPVKLDNKTDMDTSVTNYEYDTKGVLVKENKKGRQQGKGYESSTTYQYLDNGLVSRKDTKKDEEDEDWEKIYETFRYKYY